MVHRPQCLQNRPNSSNGAGQRSSTRRHLGKEQQAPVERARPARASRLASAVDARRRRSRGTPGRGHSGKGAASAWTRSSVERQRDDGLRRRPTYRAARVCTRSRASRVGRMLAWVGRSETSGSARGRVSRGRAIQDSGAAFCRSGCAVTRGAGVSWHLAGPTGAVRPVRGVRPEPEEPPASWRSRYAQCSSGTSFGRGLCWLVPRRRARRVRLGRFSGRSYRPRRASAPGCLTRSGRSSMTQPRVARSRWRLAELGQERGLGDQVVHAAVGRDMLSVANWMIGHGSMAPDGPMW